MDMRPLGSTGIAVSRIAFGAGPVSGLLTGTDTERQQAAITRAIALGVNWFDTAAGYGQGMSETNLGQALQKIRGEHPIHVATKIRVQLTGTQDQDLRPIVLAALQESLTRLKLPRVTLLQVHNSITRNRGDQPTSITPADLLGPRGLLAGMQQAQAAGMVAHLGLTGIGDCESLQTVLRSGAFAAIQAPLHLLNASALVQSPAALCDPDHGGFLQTAHQQGMGIFAIRVFAGGALVGAEPSAHTLKAPFFPLDLYRKDQARAARLEQLLGHSFIQAQGGLSALALRYVLSQPEVTAAIIGFGQAAHVDEAIRAAQFPALTPEQLDQIAQAQIAVARNGC